MNQNINDDDDIDTLTKPEQVQANSLSDDLWSLQQNGIGCDKWINNSFYVHSQIINADTLDGDYDEILKQIKLEYENANPKYFEKDLELSCIDGKLTCSKLILMARSEYFSMMLGCTQFSWSETRDSSVALDLFVAEVEAMVNFCQSGVLPDSIELISQLSIIADRFLMPSLSGLCQQELSRILVHERCPKSAVKVGCPRFFSYFKI